MDHEKLRKLVDGIYTCSWAKSADAICLEEYHIKGVLVLSLNKKTPQILSYYSDIGIYQYTIPINNDDYKSDFAKRIDDIVRIIRHFQSNKANLLIHVNSEEKVLTSALTVYFLAAAYMAGKVGNQYKYIEILTGLGNIGLPIDINSTTVPAIVEYENKLKKQQEGGSFASV